MALLDTAPLRHAGRSVPAQPTLFGSGPAGLAEGPWDRIDLDGCCWLEHRPGWLRGSNELLPQLLDTIPWASQRRPMYERVVDVPRLTYSCPLADDLVPAVLVQAGHAIGSRYGVHIDAVGFNLYRDGADSVAWHGDRIAERRRAAVVAVASLGGPRPFLVRSVEGGRSRRFELGHGDVLVMGGLAQVHWQHCVPKRVRAPARVSVVYRAALGSAPDQPD